MRISTKGRYALVLMLDLAMYDSGGPVRLKDVARRQQISEKYLEQIISILNKAGFVKSIRGPQGGYRLRYEPEKYTVGMILRQTEGELSPVCYEDEESREREAVISRIWVQMESAVNRVVDKITLSDLMDWQAEHIEEGEYVI